MLQTLFECRQQVSKELGIPEEELELSMGMSGDFEQAVSNHIDFKFHITSEDVFNFIWWFNLHADKVEVLYLDSMLLKMLPVVSESIVMYACT